MFKRIMKSRKSMEARIKELEAMKESMYKVMETQADQICKLREEINYWQEGYETVQYAYDEYVDYVEEQKEVMENYLYELKEKLEEAEGADEYIAELEEALFKENPNHVLVKGMAQYYGERDAIDAVCRVKDEVLLLMAPVEEVKTTITTTVITTVATEMSDGTIVTETTTTTKEEEINLRIKKVMAKVKKPQPKSKKKPQQREVASEVRRTPPLPPHGRKAC